LTSRSTSEPRSDRWITFDIEFFDFMYDNKSMFTEEFIEHVEKNTYFRNVHLFLKRVKDVAKVKNVAQVRENLFTCLRELALQWYTFELSENIKNLLRYEQDIKYWEKKLIKRFKESVSVAMTSLIKKKYIMKNARRRRESREYVEVILRVVKSAELISKISQIFLIYNEIDVKFQRDISMSKADTKLNNFLTDLDDKKNVWWQLIDRKRIDENSYENTHEYFAAYSTQYFTNYSRFRNDRTRSFRFTSSESSRYDQSYDENRTYQSRDFFSSYDDSDKTNFNSFFFFKSQSNQNDINRIQKSSFADTNANSYSSRSDSFRNDSSSTND
jgi:hypothetical protein